MVEGLVFEATGRPDEFQTTFTVPSTEASSNEPEEGCIEIAYACCLSSIGNGEPDIVTRELVKPGGLIELEWGEGLLVIDQIGWEAEPAPVPAHVCGALLLTNLAESR